MSFALKTRASGHGHARTPEGSDRYKWIALSNTTLGVLLATLDASITLIAMPAIFRGIHLDPLAPGNVGYLLWILMAYLLVTGFATDRERSRWRLTPGWRGYGGAACPPR